MQPQILKFTAALRKLGVPVSVAESLDAQRALDAAGVSDRETFRQSLLATLIKSRRDQTHFNTLFPMFFGASPSPPVTDIGSELRAEELTILREFFERFDKAISDMLERLLQGEPLSGEELERLTKQAGIEHADDLRYQGWVARRIAQALRLHEVPQALAQLLEALVGAGLPSGRSSQIVDALEENRGTLLDQIRDHVGRQIAENLGGREPEPGNDLLDKSFATLTEADMRILRDEVKRLAALLRSRVALRQKRARSGHIDPKATLRANLRYGGVPLVIKHRSRHLKPKIVVLCDISTSMRYCSELMLSLLYELQDQVSKTHAFAFIDRLEYITPDLVELPADEAVQAVLARNPPGYYSTDLGFSLRGFERDHMHTIDSRTSFILVGDGRNNFNDPNLPVFEKIARRSHRTLWINPENRAQWAVGDSDMRSYAPYCDDILQAATLNQLTHAVDRMLI